MLFRVCEHYDDDTNYKNALIEVKDCFICFELINANEFKKNKLNNNSLFIKNCRCDGYVHKKCLKIWFDIHKSCPICRKTVSIILYKYIPFGYYIYLKIINVSYIMIRIMIILIGTYNLFDFYLRIYRFNSKIYEDYTYFPDVLHNESDYI